MRRGKRLGPYAVLIAAFLAGCNGGTEDTKPDGAPVDSPSPSQTGPNDPTPAAGKGSATSTPAAGSGAPAAGAGSTTKPNPGTAGKPGGQAGSGAAEPLSGVTDFDSADSSGSSNSAGGVKRGAAENTATPPATAPTAPTTDAATMGAATSRAVERGDIFRVLPDQRILNLNNYRGVQILDVSDVNKPRIEGRLPVAGSPVELYVVGERAIVLLNNWQGYYGNRDDLKVESVSGGLVMSVDITDRAHPKLIHQATVPGSILTSRMTQGDGVAALYVAATNYDVQQRNTVVKSFDVSSGMIVPKSELGLGGYVQDIQATTNLLMVAGNDYQKNQGRSEVTLIDISSPDGTMVRGGTVLAQGIVQSKFNMDAYKGVLRVVSGANWNGSLENHVETFSLANLQNPVALDDCKFGRRDPMTGQSEQLYATLFVQDRAFFVTYFRVDPFHAFSIDQEGHCVEHSEFIVSGWNDFLRATLGDTRLIGIGRNDQNSTLKLSVSLYDAVNLTNPNPLKARADIDLAYSHSEATWDDRGFSVLEDAVSVKASDGTTETGLVLLPFSGWNQDTQEQISEVQIFTFSDHTLTKRGTMNHGSAVRRSFEVKADLTANLSDEQLSLFDTTNPDSPKGLGRVDVAPNYTQIFVYGDHVARLRDRTSYYYPRVANQSQEPAKNLVQVLSRSADLDGSEVLSSFEVPAGSLFHQVGQLLVSVYSVPVPDNTGKSTKYQSTVRVFDLSDPAKPRARGVLETDRIMPSYGGFYPPGRPIIADCFDCGGILPYHGAPQSFVVGQAIAFLHTTQQQKSLGLVHQCYISAPGQDCRPGIGGSRSCPTSYVSGGMTCTTPMGGKAQCVGEFYRCDDQGCVPTGRPANAITSCSDYEQFRYWTSYGFDPLDLRDADAPVMAPRLDLPSNEEGSSVIASGSKLYANLQQPVTKKDDPRSYVKHYVRLLDFADPAAPVRGELVNVPGDVIAVDGDTLYTRDYVWNDQNARTLVARLTLSGNLAHLQASHLFADRSVNAVAVDGAGHVLASSDPVYVARAPTPAGAEPQKHQLSILDAQSFDVLSQSDIDSWATFKSAKSGKALFQVSGGLLIFNIEDAAHPKAQAYFPTQGWPRDVFFDGQDILFAAGNYGVYRFDANVFNLLMK